MKFANSVACRTEDFVGTKSAKLSAYVSSPYISVIVKTSLKTRCLRFKINITRDDQISGLILLFCNNDLRRLRLEKRQKSSERTKELKEIPVYGELSVASMETKI